jgi:anti-sigma factor RsiW
MKCNHARKLFAAFWDDETTQAEREWLESHFSTCAKCRGEYEAYARTLELLGSLPRIEAAPDLAERALARARRAETAPDRLPVGRPLWVPVAAGAAAMAVIGLILSGPLGALRQGSMIAGHARPAIHQPVLVPLPEPVAVQSPAGNAAAKHLRSGNHALPDSLFDHSEDIEFVLDPVTLHRGRASVNRGTTQGERAVITF